MSMPYYSRGGAGNIGAIEQRRQRVAADLEANEAVAEDTLGERIVADSISRHEAQEYVRSGRGGAGNYHSPGNMSKSEKFDSGSTPGLSGRTATADTTRTYGRGGHGNYAISIAESAHKAAQQQRDDDVKRAELSRDIEKAVQEKLTQPSKAKLPGGTLG